MNLPSSFIERTKELLSELEWTNFTNSLEEKQPVSVRVNTKKANAYNFKLALENANPVPWCPSGFYLEKRPTFTFDPLFHAGMYYVQEASSMFIGEILRQYLPKEDRLVALDLCAAPGGKTTLLKSYLPAKSLLIANEIINKRAQILSENMQKWGDPDIMVTNNKSEHFTPFKSLFDLILADVPCSGEGMFRKDETAIEEWSVENVNTCWKRQREIIENIWPSLKPGGLLIYSTCTYNKEENEDNIQWIIDEFGAESLPVEIDSTWGVLQGFSSTNPCYRFMPHRTKGEGFFVAILRKPGQWTPNKSTETKDKKKNKTKDKGLSISDFGNYQEWINDTLNYSPIVSGENLYLFPTQYLPILTEMKKAKIHFMHIGLPLAYLKGKSVFPNHALALSKLLNKNAFEHVDVDYPTAISYLRKEAVTLPATTSKGFILLTYRNIPLGFVKNIGNRSNNLYPQEWRIRSQYTPENLQLL